MGRMARRADPNRCPSCKGRVSPFAAGCSTCGASLDPRRHQGGGPSLPRRMGQAMSTRLQYGGTRRPPNLAPDWKERPFRAIAIGIAFLLVVSAGLSLVASLLSGLL